MPTDDDIAPTRKRLAPEERKAQILDVAVRLFAEKGYDGTTTRDISEAAGVAEGLIFRYFRSKAEILDAVLDLHQPVAHLTQLMAQVGDLPFREAVVYVFTRLMDHALDMGELWHIAAREAFRSEDLWEKHCAVDHEAVQVLSGFLRERIERGELRPLDTMLAAEVMWGAGHSFFISHCETPSEVSGPLLHWFVTEATDLFLRGMLPAGG